MLNIIVLSVNMLNVANKLFMLSVIMLNVIKLSVIMLNVANKPFMLSDIIMLNAIKQSVVMLNVVAPIVAESLNGLNFRRFQPCLQILELGWN